MFQRKKVPLGTTCRTGQICPEAGVWRAMVPPPTGATERSLTVFTSLDARRAPIAIGNHFPPYDRLAVNWVLVEYA